MPLEHILAAIQTDGEQACARIAAEGDRRVKLIMAEAETRAAGLRAAELRQGHEVAHNEQVTRRYQARLEAGRRRSAAWQEAYQATLEAARAALPAVRGRPDYPQLVRRLLFEALNELDGLAVIAVAPQDEPIVAEALQELGVDAPLESKLTTWGGLEARTGDSRIIVRNTLESRLARAEPALPALVSAIWRTDEPAGAPSAGIDPATENHEAQS